MIPDFGFQPRLLVGMLRHLYAEGNAPVDVPSNSQASWSLVRLGECWRHRAAQAYCVLLVMERP